MIILNLIKYLENLKLALKNRCNLSVGGTDISQDSLRVSKEAKSVSHPDVLPQKSYYLNL